MSDYTYTNESKLFLKTLILFQIKKKITCLKLRM